MKKTIIFLSVTTITSFLALVVLTPFVATKAYSEMDINDKSINRLFIGDFDDRIENEIERAIRDFGFNDGLFDRNDVTDQVENEIERAIRDSGFNDGLYDDDLYDDDYYENKYNIRDIDDQIEYEVNQKLRESGVNYIFD